MRGIERTLGLLSGALALAALVVTLSQHTVQVIPGGRAVYGPGMAETSAALLFAPAALAAILCAVVAALPRSLRQAPALA